MLSCVASMFLLTAAEYHCLLSQKSVWTATFKTTGVERKKKKKSGALKLAVGTKSHLISRKKHKPPNVA